MSQPLVHKMVCCLIALLACVAFPVTAWGTTVTFQQGVDGYASTQDAYVDFNAPTSNFGGSSTLWTLRESGTTPGEYHTARVTYLAFDDIFGAAPNQIPAGSSILSATLTLESFDAGLIILNPVAGAWNENTLTAQTVPSSTLTSLDTIAVNSTTQIDVTSYLLSWASGTANWGWEIRDDGSPPHGSSTDTRFRSSEYGTISQRPHLSVTYVPEPSTLCMALTAIVSGLFVAWRRKR